MIDHQVNFTKSIINAAALIFLGNFVLGFLPIPGLPLLLYFSSGALAVYFFVSSLDEENRRAVKASEASILGLLTGALIAGLQTLVLILKLQDPEFKQSIIDTINEGMKMQSQAEFTFLEDLGPSFYIVTAVMMFLTCSLVALFGSLASLTFFNKAKK